MFFKSNSGKIDLTDIIYLIIYKYKLNKCKRGDKMRQLLKKYGFIIIISFVILFFVGFQIYRITQLDLHYLGEEVSLNIVPSYIFFLAIIPVVLLLIVLLPGLVIVSISLKLPVYNPEFKESYNIYIKPLRISFIRILNRNQIFNVIRC